MFWTWDRYPADAGRWRRDGERVRRSDPVANFLTNIDRMIYVAAAAFAACIVGIVVT